MSLRNVDVVRYDPATVVISQGLETGEVVVTAGRRADAAPGPEGPAPGSRLMNRFNLSEWAIRHRSLVTYFMLVIVVAGVGSYLRLGRSEDPDFTVKTMVVQADGQAPQSATRSSRSPTASSASSRRRRTSIT